MNHKGHEELQEQKKKKIIERWKKRMLSTAVAGKRRGVLGALAFEANSEY